MNSPRCGRCGSDYLHRARMRAWWQRLLKRLTPLRRYACDDCGHRGWTAAPLEGSSQRLAAGPGPSGGRGPDRGKPLAAIAAVVLIAGLLGGLIP